MKIVKVALKKKLINKFSGHALVDAYGGRVPGFHKLAFIFRRSHSHDGSSVPVEDCPDVIQCKARR